MATKFRDYPTDQIDEIMSYLDDNELPDFFKKIHKNDPIV